MAKPRVFVSSTYYDLKHVRSSLDLFIESLGFEPVLSEQGDIAYLPELPVIESCYREARNADIFVLIIGGRYGSDANGKQKTADPTFYERYESITKLEYESAIARDVPVYVLVEGSVYSEYQTYKLNKSRTDIAYAHVGSVNVFKLLEEIESKPRNNPTKTFDRSSEIESWLRDQWAGLFRELLQKQSQQQQLSALGAQVSELRAINETLKKYLEAVMKGTGRKESEQLIESEHRRLNDLERVQKIRNNRWVVHALVFAGYTYENFLGVVRTATSFKDFAERVKRASSDSIGISNRVLETLLFDEKSRNDLNEVRLLLGLEPFSFP